MNVLVYSGPGVSAASLTHTLSSLRTALSPSYAVQPILAPSLAHDPWPPSCALLVIPGGRDLPYVSALAPAIPRIREYVRKGGRFLALCAGAYFACARVEFEVGSELEVSGARQLAFFPGTCQGCTFPGFRYESEDGARAVSLTLDLPAWSLGEEVAELPETVHGIYYNGGGHFLSADTPAMRSRGISVLARYASPQDPSKSAAAVLCRIERGLALLISPHIEYPLPLEPLRSALSKSTPPPTPQQRAEWESTRTTLFLASLRALGLNPPPPAPTTALPQPTTPLPQFLISAPSRPDLVAHTVQLLGLIMYAAKNPAPITIKDAADTFHVHDPPAAAALLLEARTRYVDQTSEGVPPDFPKMVVAYRDGALPEREYTPLFDLGAFFEELERVREATGLKADSEEDTSRPWGMGELMLYGEVVTSTQSMLDRNPTLLSTLPTPLLSLATFQLSGRGRGANLWLSPSGCLQFSLHVRPPPSLPAAKLVFVQYLFGLAAVEACRAVLRELGGGGERVRLKWPNDLMAVVENRERRKLGGVLVSTNHLKGRFEVVIGCGINVLNTQPSTSLKHLLELANSTRVPDLTLERVAATILPTFERMWTRFLDGRGDFRPFEELYLTRWLHSDQLVTLTTTTPHTPVRIVGITLDHGLLRTVPAQRDPWKRAGAQEEYIDLQPDGNSFDMIEGLIKRKT